MNFLLNNRNRVVLGKNLENNDILSENDNRYGNESESSFDDETIYKKKTEKKSVEREYHKKLKSN